MPKFLIEVSYTPDGGASQSGGGTYRRDAVAPVAESVGNDSSAPTVERTEARDERP